MITLGSLFDGSGGFPLAGAMNGAIPLWAAEVEPYPIAVTKSRFPNMRHLGDVSTVHGGEIPPVDIITFGSPCQDMSIAGKRAGMKHEEKGNEETTRSGLFYEAVRIIREMREATNDRYPAFAVWENVPGAFSSQRGEDFRCVLQELAQIAARECVSIPRPTGGKWLNAGEIVGDGFSVAWRVFDAQHWGVPQRRKRIYVVADFRGKRAGKILFERESLRGNIASSGEAREEATADVDGCTDGGCGLMCLNALGYQSKRIYDPAGVYPTLPEMDCGGANNQAVIYPADGVILNDQGGSVMDVSENVAMTLRAQSHQHEPVVCYALQENGMHDKQAILVKGKPPRKYIVRRLTPLECCRLQGFPDGWGVPDKKYRMTEEEVAFWESVWRTHARVIGKKYTPCKSMDALLKKYNGLHTDSAEYKMWGNGIALPNAYYVVGGCVVALMGGMAT